MRPTGSQGPKVSSCGQQRLYSDWADAQADLNLSWAHSHFVAFVKSQLNYEFYVLHVDKHDQREKNKINLNHPALKYTNTKAAFF